MLIILAPITGGVRCGYSSTGPIKKKKREKKREKKERAWGRWGRVKWRGVNNRGGGVTLSIFSV